MVLADPRVACRSARFLARILACFLLWMFFLALVFGISSPVLAFNHCIHRTPLESRAPKLKARDRYPDSFPFSAPCV